MAWPCCDFSKIGLSSIFPPYLLIMKNVESLRNFYYILNRCNNISLCSEIYSSSPSGIFKYSFARRGPSTLETSDGFLNITEAP